MRPRVCDTLLCYDYQTAGRKTICTQHGSILNVPPLKMIARSVSFISLAPFKTAAARRCLELSVPQEKLVPRYRRKGFCSMFWYSNTSVNPETVCEKSCCKTVERRSEGSHCVLCMTKNSSAGQTQKFRQFS